MAQLKKERAAMEPSASAREATAAMAWAGEIGRWRRELRERSPAAKDSEMREQRLGVGRGRVVLENWRESRKRERDAIFTFFLLFFLFGYQWVLV